MQIPGREREEDAPVSSDAWGERWVAAVRSARRRRHPMPEPPSPSPGRLGIDYGRAIGLDPREKPNEGRDRRMHANGPRPIREIIGPKDANYFWATILNVLCLRYENHLALEVGPLGPCRCWEWRAHIVHHLLLLGCVRIQNHEAWKWMVPFQHHGMVSYPVFSSEKSEEQNGFVFCSIWTKKWNGMEEFWFSSPLWCLWWT
jgi:hypothetical protein